MVAFWTLVWILIIVQMIIGIVLVQMVYNGEETAPEANPEVN